jgi:PAS domain S-box-containing protein
MLYGTYNPTLVIVSVLIASIASYAAFSLAERVTAYEGSRRFGWITGGAFAMGLGIWSMHYIGMLAFTLAVPVRYHVPTVGLSLIAAVLASAVTLHIVGNKKTSVPGTSIGGLTMGAAICSMHYIGMAAMRSTAMHQYNSWLVGVSAMLAVVCSFVALWLVFRFKHSPSYFDRAKIGGATLMGGGISAMHYTAMAAAQFHTPSITPDLSFTVAVSSLGAAAIAGTSVVVLVTTLISSWLDRRLTSERLMRHVLESVDILLWQSNSETVERRFINPPTKALFGLGPGELRDCIWESHIHPEDRVAVFTRLREAAMTPQPAFCEYRLIAPDRETFWVREIVRGISVGGRKRLLGTTLDITELKRVQEALIAKEKIGALGKLAATIAHEINNPLAAVGNILYIARSHPTVPNDLQEHLQVAEQELKRAAEITRHALSFARVDAEISIHIDLGHMLRDLLQLYRPQMKNKELRLETDFRAELPLQAHAGELRQIFANLIANAIDAAPHRGSIRIRTTQWSERQHACRRGVLVIVGDTGPGIPLHLQKRIFEPFFTTKKDVGTGLGLSIVQQLVSRQKGWVKVRSRCGVGTVFAIFLPCFALSKAHLKTLVVRRRPSRSR